MWLFQSKLQVIVKLDLFVSKHWSFSSPLGSLIYLSYLFEYNHQWVAVVMTIPQPCVTTVAKKHMSWRSHFFFFWNILDKYNSTHDYIMYWLIYYAPSINALATLSVLHFFLMLLLLSFCREKRHCLLHRCKAPSPLFKSSRSYEHWFSITAWSGRHIHCLDFQLYS